jgi:hypothetical protein
MQEALKLAAKLRDNAYKAGYVAGIADTLAELGSTGAFKGAAYTDAPDVAYKPSCGRLGPKRGAPGSAVARQALDKRRKRG